MARPATVKPDRKNNGSQKDKSTVKKEKFEPLTGWQTPLSSTIIGLEAWIKRKDLSSNTEFRKKKQQQQQQQEELPWEAFLCDTRHRCTGIYDLPEFEDESLIPSLRPRNFVPLKKVAVDETKEETGKEEVEEQEGGCGEERKLGDALNSERAKTAGCVQGTLNVQDESRSKSAGSTAKNKNGLTTLSVDQEENNDDAPVEKEEKSKDKETSVETSCEDRCRDNEDRNIKTADQKPAKNSSTLGVTAKKPRNSKRSQLFNTVESISRLLQKNPVRLSYTRTNFLLKQKGGYWDLPNDGESVSVASDPLTEPASVTHGTNSTALSVAESSENGDVSDTSSDSSETMSHSEIPEFNLTGTKPNPLLHPNDYRTFGHFERTHTINVEAQTAQILKSQVRELHKVQSAPELGKPEHRKPKPTVAKKISIQDLNENSGLSHQAAISAVLASRIRDIAQSNDSIAVRANQGVEVTHNNDSNSTYGTGQERVQSSPTSGQLNYVYHPNTIMKQVPPVFNIGDLLPVVDRNFSVSVQRNGNLQGNYRNESKDSQQAFSLAMPGNDRLLSYEESVLMVKEGVDLGRLKERNQDFLGPPAFRPRVARSPLQRGREAAHRKTYSRPGNQQSHTGESQLVNSARSDAKHGSSSAPLLRHSEPNGLYHHNSSSVKSPVKLSRPRITAHLINQIRKRPTSNLLQSSVPTAHAGH